MLDAAAGEESAVVNTGSIIALAGLAAAALVLAFGGGGATTSTAVPMVALLGIGLLALALGGALASPPPRRWPGWPALAASVALAGLAAASLIWTESRGLTSDATVNYTLAALAIVLAAIACRGAQLALLGVLTTAAVPSVVAAVAALHLLAGRPDLLFEKRLVYPVGYANGAAALYLIGAMAALGLAAFLPWRASARAALAGVAGFLFAAGALTGSRGGVLGAVAALIVLLVAAPSRIRGVLMTLAVLVGPLLAAPLLFAGSGQLALKGIGMLLAGVVSYGAGFAVARYEASLLGRWQARSVRIAAAAVVALVVLALVGAVVARYGAPWTIASHGWHDFRRPHRTRDNLTIGQHFSSANTNRYEYWRVAYRAWLAHPLVGVGVGAYPVEWFRHRSLFEDVSDAHGWPFRLGSELGLAGLALYLVFIGGLVAAAVACRRRGGLHAAVGAAAAASAAYFLAHGAVDWLSTISAVLIVGQLAAGALLGAAAPAATRAAGRTLHAVVAGLAAAALVVAIPIWVSNRYLASAEQQSDPSRAVALLRAARDWNPYEITPLQVEAEVRVEAGDIAGAEAALRKAIELDPNRWEPWVQLSRVLQFEGRTDDSRHAFAEATKRNPIGVPIQYGNG
jgi:hypothetical protein